MSVKVASVHFRALHAERAMFKQGVFDLPAVPFGGDPVMIEIFDQTQIERGPYVLAQISGQRSLHHYPVSAASIARDIVYQWAQNGLGMTSGCAPGVWVVRDQVPETDKEGNQIVDHEKKAVYRQGTPEEFRKMFAEDLAAARASTMEYARWCVLEGNTMAQIPAKVPLIPPAYREAARYLKAANFLTTEPAWVVPTEQVITNVKECEYCTKVIPKKAIVCPECQNIVDVEAFARLEAEKNAAMAKAAKKAG